MVTLAELTASITADAQAQADRIDEEAQAEVERIRAETAQMIKEQKAKLQQQAKQQELEIAARMEAKRELVARQAMLQAKQQLLDDVFKSAAEQLYNLKGAKRQQLIKALLQDAGKQIQIGSLLCARPDARSMRGFKVEAVDCKGGFIARSKDGSVQVDMRFETLIADVKARKSAEVAAALFSEPAKEKKPPAKTVTKSPVKKSTVKRKRSK